MAATPLLMHSAAHRRVCASLTAVAAFAALAILTGCSGAGSAPRVTITVPPTEAASSSDTPPEPAPPADTGDTGDTGDPATPGTYVDDGLVVTQGEIAPACTHSVCHYVHVAWDDLPKGWHNVQCVSDNANVGAWSEGNYEFPTTVGERDIGCFLAYPGSHVWIIIDGEIESPPANWG